MDDFRETIIIGSGPAGLTAAIYAARANLRPLVIEGEVSSTSDQPGGQLMLTTEVENFPGFPDGINGPELMERMRQQAKRFEADFVTAKVTSIDATSHPFSLVAGGTTYRAKSVIIATGARSRMLGLPNELSLIGRGVSTCATCDGFFFRGQDIAVVGGGDSAIEEATFLTKFANSVTLIHRRDELRASKIMQDRALSNEKIRFAWNSEVVEILENEKLTGVRLKNVQTNELSDLPITGLFIAIGHIPNTDVFRGVVATDDTGYVLTAADSPETSVPGIFACGDVQDTQWRQAITAAGSGCTAAIAAERWLEAQHDSER